MTLLLTAAATTHHSLAHSSSLTRISLPFFFSTRLRGFAFLVNRRSTNKTNTTTARTISRSRSSRSSNNFFKRIPIAILHNEITLDRKGNTTNNNSDPLQLCSSKQQQQQQQTTTYRSISSTNMRRSGRHRSGAGGGRRPRGVDGSDTSARSRIPATEISSPQNEQQFRRDTTTTDHCIFCKILQHQVPGSTVYEDDVCTVILDIHPVRPGHMLIFPKQHYEHIMSPHGGMRQEMSMHMMRLAHLITTALTKKDVDVVIDCDGTNLVMNNGKAAWQTVPHAHLHVIPRSHGDTFAFLWGCTKHLLSMVGLARRKDPQELDDLAAKMSHVLFQEIQSKQRL